MSLLAAAACGGGGEDRLSREEFISQADAICLKYAKDAAAVGLPESFADFGEWAPEAKAISERVLRELRALEPPEDLEEEYDRLIFSNKEQVDRLGELARAGAEGDRARVEEIAEEGSQTEPGDDRLANQIGFRDCEQWNIFEGEGYSLAYPEDWDQREGEVTMQAGQRCSSVYLAPGRGADGVSISVCRQRQAATEQNIDGLLDGLAAEVEQSLRQAQGRITKGPSRVTVDGLPALRVDATVITSDGVRVHSQFLILFKGATRFSLTCQFRSASAEEMRRGCDLVFSSFQVH
jgi:hypothetical protein